MYPATFFPHFNQQAASKVDTSSKLVALQSQARRGARPASYLWSKYVGDSLAVEVSAGPVHSFLLYCTDSFANGGRPSRTRQAAAAAAAAVSCNSLASVVEG